MAGQGIRFHRSRSFRRRNPIGYGGKVLRKVVVQLGGEPRALVRAQFGIAEGAPADEEFASAPFGERVQRDVPCEYGRDDQHERAYDEHEPQGRPPGRRGEDFDVLGRTD